jgi:ketosteroid isomerase-like protein
MARRSREPDRDVPARFQTIERRWAEAVVKHQPGLIAQDLDDRILVTGDDGKVRDKTATLEMIRTASATLESLELEVLQIEVHGDAAVVIGHFFPKGRSADGKPFQASGYFTDTFIRKDGRWLCIASHSSTDPAR